MLLYADEDFAFPAVEELRVRGHDVLTAQEDGQTAMPDAVILACAFALGRVVLTHNRRHYVRPASCRGGARRYSDCIAGFRSSGPGQSDRRNACELISWPMVLPRESAAVSLKYGRSDLNPHHLYGDRILSPVRLPFPWYRKHVAAALKLDETEKVRLRKQALDWLCADPAAPPKNWSGPTARGTRKVNLRSRPVSSACPVGRDHRRHGKQETRRRDARLLETRRRPRRSPRRRRPRHATRGRTEGMAGSMDQRERVAQSCREVNDDLAKMLLNVTDRPARIASFQDQRVQSSPNVPGTRTAGPPSKSRDKGARWERRRPWHTYDSRLQA